MRLAALRVHNVRSYRDARLELPLGTTLIAGDVGAGKTSLLYAIEMALFGPSQVNAEHLVRHRAAEAEVILEVEDHGAPYVFRRRLRRHLSRGRASFDPDVNAYTADGRTTEYSATELRQRSIELLGFPDNPNPRARSDVWRWAVYIPQERMREVLDQNPTTRVEAVRKALGLEQYRTAWENADLVRKSLEDRAGGVESEVDLLRHWEEDLRVATDQSAVAAATARQLTDEEPSLRDRRTTAETGLRAVQAQLTLREGMLQRRLALASEISELTRRGAALEQAIAAQRREAEELDVRACAHAEAAGALDRQIADADEIRRRVTILRAESEALDQHRDEEGRRETELAIARRTVEESESRRDELRAAWERSRDELREADAQGPGHEPPPPTPRDLPTIEQGLAEIDHAVEVAVAAEADQAHLAEDLREIVGAGTCPRCHQAVSPEEFRAHLAEAERTVVSARADKARLLREKEETIAERRARERYERARDHFLQIAARRAELRAVVERAVQALADAEERVGAARRSLDRAREQREEVQPQIDRRHALRSERDLAERQLAEVEEHQRRASTLRVQEAASREAAELRRQDADRRRPELAEMAAAQARSAEELVRLDEELERGAELTRTRRAAEAALVEAQTAWEAALSRRAAAEHSLRTAEEQRARAEAHLADRDLRRAHAAHLRALSEWLTGIFRPALVDLERRRLAQAQGEFDRTLARYFAALVDDPTFVARIDGSFSPRVEIDGEETDAAALSGGERTALALAYRLAMGHVVRGLGRLRLGTMILDEPTDGFSPEQIDRMGDLIRELALPQVILVSHEEELAGVADHVVRVTKEGGISRITGAGSSPAAVAEAELPLSPTPRRRSPRSVSPNATPPAAL